MDRRAFVYRHTLCQGRFIDAQQDCHAVALSFACGYLGGQYVQCRIVQPCNPQFTWFEGFCNPVPPSTPNKSSNNPGLSFHKLSSHHVKLLPGKRQSAGNRTAVGLL